MNCKREYCNSSSPVSTNHIPYRILIDAANTLSSLADAPNYNYSSFKGGYDDDDEENDEECHGSCDNSYKDNVSPASTIQDNHLKNRNIDGNHRDHHSKLQETKGMVITDSNVIVTRDIYDCTTAISNENDVTIDTIELNMSTESSTTITTATTTTTASHNEGDNSSSLNLSSSSKNNLKDLYHLSGYDNRLLFAFGIGLEPFFVDPTRDHRFKLLFDKKIYNKISFTPRASELVDEIKRRSLIRMPDNGRIPRPKNWMRFEMVSFLENHVVLEDWEKRWIMDQVQNVISNGYKELSALQKNNKVYYHQQLHGSVFDQNIGKQNDHEEERLVDSVFKAKPIQQCGDDAPQDEHYNSQEKKNNRKRKNRHKEIVNDDSLTITSSHSSNNDSITNLQYHDLITQVERIEKKVDLLLSTFMKYVNDE